MVEHSLRHGRLILSKPLVDEVRGVIRRPKFDRILPLPDRMIEIETVIAAAELVFDLPPISASRDPDDDMVLATALAGQADVIVSGDADLLELHPFRGIPVLTPVAFLEWAGAAPP